MTLAYQDGRFLAEERLTISPRDAGFRVGDGLFETLLAVDGRVLDPAAHLDRLERGLAELEIAVPGGRAELASALERVAVEGPRPRARLRLTVTRGTPEAGPTRILTAEPFTPPAAVARGDVAVVVVPEVPVLSGDRLRAIKSTSYQRCVLAGRAAASRGAFEGLLVNERERLVEGTRTNVVVELEGRLVTPPLDDGCLPGTVRRRLLEAGEVVEAPVARAALSSVRQLYLTNSLLGIVPASSLEGASLEEGRARSRLLAAWRSTWS